MLWVEIRAGLRRSGKPKLVPHDEVDRYVGFRSVYSYPDTTAHEIRTKGNTVDMSSAVVHSDMLFLDFDNGGHGAAICNLIGKGAAFDAYHSGNRSTHIHVPIHRMSGSEVPYSQKVYVEREFPTADTSFYHPAGQYRLPFTFHDKNPGHCKTHLVTRGGRPLTIPLIQQEQSVRPHLNEGIPYPSSPVSHHDDRTTQDRSMAYHCLLLQSKGSGHRRPHIFKMVCLAMEIGKTAKELEDDLMWWNDRWARPALSVDNMLRFVMNIIDRRRRVAV